MLFTIGKAAGQDLRCDLTRLLATRLLVQASSGGGKSWLLRRLLEQTHGHVQQIVIDPEGEFASLREKYDYILGAPTGGDTQTHPRTAAMLAERLLELRVSAVLDIYDLPRHDQVTFVQRFVAALVAAPKKLWHPVMVVLDEAHLFAAEKGSGDAESTSAVIDLATRGRKRGFCLVPATQRLSKLHKDVASECRNKLIGLTNLDIDMDRVAKELGFKTNEQRLALRDRDEGEFFAFGPAISKQVTSVLVGGIETTHPKAGARLTFKAPPPTAAVRALLPKLADLPEEAAQREASIEDLRREIARLKREVAEAKRAAPAAAKPSKRVRVVTVKVKAIDAKAQARLVATAEKAETGATAALAASQHWGGVAGQLKAAAAEARTAVATAAAQREITYVYDEATGILHEASKAPPAPPAARRGPVPAPGPRPPRATADSQRSDLPARAATGSDSTLGKCERAILQVLAQRPEGCTAATLTLLAGYRYSGGFKNSLTALRTAGLIVGANTEIMHITEAGLDAGPFDPLPTGAALVGYWLAHPSLGTCERKVLSVLVNYGGELTAAQLCAATGYQYSGGFKNALTALRTAGLLVGKNTGAMRACAELLEAARAA